MMQQDASTIILSILFWNLVLESLKYFYVGIGDLPVEYHRPI